MLPVHWRLGLTLRVCLGPLSRRAGASAPLATRLAARSRLALAKTPKGFWGCGRLCLGCKMGGEVDLVVAVDGGQGFGVGGVQRLAGLDRLAPLQAGSERRAKGEAAARSYSISCDFPIRYETKEAQAPSMNMASVSSTASGSSRSEWRMPSWSLV